MVALPYLHPVVETPWFEGQPPWPWPIADRKGFSFMRLSGEMTESEVGSVMAQLVSYNQIDGETTVNGLLSEAVAAESLLLPGGIQASEGEREIDPGCCCGLESWREWVACLGSGRSPWMGHDPDPWIGWAGGVVRIWSGGGITPAQEPIAIEFERGRFAAELSGVEQDLRAFLPLVANWARYAGFTDPPALCRKLGECFKITGAVEAE